MKNTLGTITAFLISAVCLACPVCKEKQPAGFENITHGSGPEGNWDYVIMYAAIVIVGYTLIMSIKYLIKPNETNKDHIKNLILDNQNLKD